MRRMVDTSSMTDALAAVPLFAGLDADGLADLARGMRVRRVRRIDAGGAQESGGRSCFLPYSRESMDQAPGPIIARADSAPGAPGWPQSASLGLADLPPAPVYLAALGPQMLRLAGQVADGALLNWATPERIAVSREEIGRLRTARSARRRIHEGRARCVRGREAPRVRGGARHETAGGRRLRVRAVSQSASVGWSAALSR